MTSAALLQDAPGRPPAPSLRMLMVSHLPWSKELGAAKVQVELAEELRALGHHVDSYCLTDAFPEASAGRSAPYVRQQLFPARARAHVRAVGDRYDVIDTLQSALPYSKRSLRFDGLLVTRSTGLHRLYGNWQREQRRRWPDTWSGHPIGRLLRRRMARQQWLRSERSVDRADLVSLLNRHELELVRGEEAWRDKAVLLQHGLTAPRFAAFDAARGAAEARLRSQEVVFVGAWSPRKGARDLGEIVARVRDRVPGCRFSFLGTGQPEAVVLGDLGTGPRDWIRVVPDYASGDLPAMLRDATLACLPSYLEGFPFSILEQLAAGLPTVAYDAPGAGETLERLDRSLLVTAGDNRAFAARVCALLESDAAGYAALSERAVTVAKGFRWDEIAAETAAVYAARLAALRA